MKKYLLIESRDPFETREVENNYALASSLATAGNDVTLYLVQNGVLPARSGARLHGLQEVINSGVQVLTDEFSLRERGIAIDTMPTGVNAAPIDIVVDQLAEGRKVIWL
jgi:predicted peroxiredoxin